MKENLDDIIWYVIDVGSINEVEMDAIKIFPDFLINSNDSDGESWNANTTAIAAENGAHSAKDASMGWCDAGYAFAKSMY